MPCVAHALPRQVTYLRAFIQQGCVLLSGVLIPSFPVADVAVSNFLHLLLGESSQVRAFKQVSAETHSACSGASRTPEHPWVTEGRLNRLCSPGPSPPLCSSEELKVPGHAY